MNKDFKKFKENHAKASKGFGDSVKKVTKATGIDKVTKKIFNKLGKDCGCDDRQKRWNEKFTYKVPKCFTEEEYNLVSAAIETKKTNFSQTELELYTKIFERIFSKKIHCSACSFPKEVWSQLKNVYELYK